MSNTSDSMLELITSIKRLTEKGKMDWTLEDPPHSFLEGSEAKIPFFCQSEFKGKQYAIFQIRRQEYDGDRDSFYWYSSTGLAIFGPNDVALLEIYQPVRELDELLETVRAHVADLSGLLQDLSAELGPDDEDDDTPILRRRVSRRPKV